MTMGRQGLAEYDENNYICALPDILPFDEVIDSLTENFRFDEAERSIAPHLRLHAVMRLSHFFTPLSQHLALYSSIMLALRQGYIGRDPSTADYAVYRQAALQRISGEGRSMGNFTDKGKACSFAFLGCSGTGKSYSVRRILETIDQTILHVQPTTVIQVVWLYVECPHKGNVRGLCLRILSALDKAMKTTTYRKIYGGHRNTVEEMLLDIEQLFTIHVVGMLVIDEIQNLREAQQSDKSAITKFFVLLVNSVSVPVITVGTLAAASVFDSVFSDARRASGLGSTIWFPLARGEDGDDEWPDFVRQLWRGQWTAVPTKLSSEILDTLYQETQGVLDLVVILYMLSQMQLIQLTAISKIADPDVQPDETITSDLIRAVAAEKFQLIQPLLRALRDGNLAALDDFGALMDFHESMELEFQKRMTDTLPRRSKIAQTDRSPSIDSKYARKLLGSLGVAPDLIEAMISSAGTGDLKLSTLGSLLGAVKNGVQKPKSPRSRKHSPAINLLKQTIEIAAMDGLDAYEALARAGHCTALSEEFPW